MPSPKPNSWIETLTPYVPGRAAAEGIAEPVKLSGNESALGPSPAVAEALSRAGASLHFYPDSDAARLRRAIAESHGLDAERVICGAGSDDLLQLAAQAYLRPGDRILHTRYGFSLYPILARSLGAEPVAVANRDWAGDVDGLLAAVTERTRIVFLDNPNNPTGAYLPASEVERLAAALPAHCLLVYDAAYAESVDAEDYTDGLDLAHRRANVLVTRTFSKTYGLAALRVGWGYAAAPIVDALHRIRLPFNTNTPAQIAAVAALEDQDHLQRVRSFTASWRRWLASELAALGLEVVPSQTNFLLLRFPETPGRTAQDAEADLRSRGYLLRWLPGQGLDDCLRLTVGDENANRAVVEHLRAFMTAPESAAARSQV